MSEAAQGVRALRAQMVIGVMMALLTSRGETSLRWDHIDNRCLLKYLESDPVFWSCSQESRCAGEDSPPALTLGVRPESGHLL